MGRFSVTVFRGCEQWPRKSNLGAPAQWIRWTANMDRGSHYENEEGCLIRLSFFAFISTLGRSTEITIDLGANAQQITITADNTTTKLKNAWCDRYLPHSRCKLNFRDTIFTQQKYQYKCTGFLMSVLGTSTFA